MMSSLDHYLTKSQPETPKPKALAKPQLGFKHETLREMAQSYFAGAGYDGERRAVYLKLYDPQTERIQFWYDNTGHTPYCLSKDSPENLRKNKELMNHPGLLGLEPARRFDALEGKDIPVTIVLARDPLSIGGRPSGCIRDIITAWEADIRYVENYIYDRKLEPGMTYSIKSGDLKQAETLSSLTGKDEFLREGDEVYQKLMARWLRMLEAPFPNYKRVAFDIEVHSPLETRVPDPAEAEYKVICASLCSSDEVRRVLILRRPGYSEESVDEIATFQTEFFDTEEDLITSLFKAINSYPFVVTFNVDDFYLRY